MLNTEVFKLLTPEAQKELEKAQLEELITRRDVKDPALFRDCYARAVDEVFDEGNQTWEIIGAFDKLAGMAFKEYHQQRKAQHQGQGQDQPDEPTDDGAPTDPTDGADTPTGTPADTEDGDAPTGEDNPQ